MTVVMLIAGGALLVVGAEGLVRGASRLAASMGIPPIVIGLTVVAFGTSSPELAVSVSSALSGDSDIALGNVVGSNIFNVLFILGLTAMIAPLVVHERIIFMEVPLMVIVSFALWLAALGGGVNRLEGGILFLCLVGYLVFLIRQSKKESKEVQQEYAAEFSEKDETSGNVVRDVIFVFAGLGLLVAGSELFVEGAIEVAESFGVSTLVIGLTVVAAGTSLPELATSILAGLKGERDIAVGNVVGSNIFNILGVLGLSAVVSNTGIPAAQAAMDFDIPVMTGIAIITAPIIFTKRDVSRWEGALFVVYYIAYTTYLILDANDAGGFDAFRAAVLFGLVPLTALVVTGLAAREFLQLRKTGSIRGARAAS